MKTMLLLALPLLLSAGPAHANDRGDRIDNRLHRRGDWIDARFDRIGERREARFDRRHS